MVIKSEKVGFMARKKLIAGERKCSKRVTRRRTGYSGEVRVCEERRILDFTVDSFISREMSCRKNDQQT